MTDDRWNEQWQELYKRTAFFPHVEWHKSWNAVEMRAVNSLEKTIWCCDNIRGFFSIGHGCMFGDNATRIFYFDRMEDAVAFKLRWV